MATQKWQFEPTARRIRVKLNNTIIADTTSGMLLIESPYELHYYFPVSDVQMEYLSESGEIKHSGYEGDAVYYDVTVGDRVVENGAWMYPAEKEGRPDLQGYVAFVWNAMDAWYEEDEQVFNHPRNPYHRVDVIRSSRHIKVELEGVTLAETTRPVLLFETGLPTRYYIPIEDVNMEYLTPTDHESICPYKGFASYWTITVNGNTYPNLVWAYNDPLDESAKIKGLLSFYNEKLDITVDGEPESRPRTVFA